MNPSTLKLIEEMIMRRHARTSVLMVFIFFLIVFLLIQPKICHQFINTPDDVSKLDNLAFEDVCQTSFPVSFLYEDHSTILIKNNSDFKTIADVENWPGNGTPSSPYLINGYNISDPSNRDLIQIKDTDVHFQIRNCLLSNGEYGISLNNVKNGQISHNIICNNSQGGIHLPDSSYNIITNNTIIYNNGDGIRLLNSNDNNLFGNNISQNNDYGIIIEYSGINTLLNNSITNNGRGGILLYDCEGSTISNNIIINHGMDGIRLHTTGNSVLDNNTVSYTANGIYIRRSGSCRLTSNNVTTNRGNGIVISDSNSCSLSNNTVKNNDDGILIHSSSNDNFLSNNSVINNRDCGIQADSSSNNRLSDNIIIDNYIYGISLENSGNNIIFNNIQVNNGLMISGDQLIDFLQTSVRNNSVNGKPLIYWENIAHSSVPSGASQVILVNCVNILVTDQHLSKVPVGVLGAYSSYLSIHNNTFANNSEYAIILENSNNNRVVFNDFYLSQVADFGSNNLFAYNYWDTWISPDNDEDGIVDEPYFIADSANNEDSHPLTCPNPPQSHFLLSPLVIHPYGGEILSMDVTIAWMSSVDSWDHEITYTVYYSADGGNHWITLESNLTTTSYIWNTFNVINGVNYSVKVNASCTEGFWATNLSNNPFTIQNAVPTTSLTPTTQKPISTTTTTTSPIPITTSTQADTPSNILPILQILELGAILFFVATLLIVYQRQRIN